MEWLFYFVGGSVGTISSSNVDSFSVLTVSRSAEISSRRSINTSTIEAWENFKFVTTDFAYYHSGSVKMVRTEWFTIGWRIVIVHGGISGCSLYRGFAG